MRRRTFISAALGAIGSLAFLRAETFKSLMPITGLRVGVWQTGLIAPRDISINGIALVKDEDYFVNGSEITFSRAPEKGDHVSAFSRDEQPGDYIVLHRTWPDLS